MDSFALGLVILEVITGLPVMLSQAHASRKLPSAQQKTLLQLWQDELCDASAELASWLDASAGAWDQHALALLHEVIGRCLELQRRKRSQVTQVVSALATAHAQQVARA